MNYQQLPWFDLIAMILSISVKSTLALVFWLLLRFLLIPGCFLIRFCQQQFDCLSQFGSIAIFQLLYQNNFSLGSHFWKVSMQETNRNVLQQRLRSQQIVIEYMKCEGKSAEETENESLQQFHFYFVMLLEYLFVKTDEPIDLVDFSFFSFIL